MDFIIQLLDTLSFNEKVTIKRKLPAHNAG